MSKRSGQQVLGVDEATSRLSLGDAHRTWLHAATTFIESRPDADLAVALPASSERRPLLAALAVPPAAAAALLDDWPDRAADPALCWLVERCAAWLVAQLGGGRRCPGAWPALPAPVDERSPLWSVYPFLAATASVRRWHAERNVPDDVSWATLRDLGRNIAIHERVHGRRGFDNQGWLTRHFTGRLFQLGRLQLERSLAPWSDDDLRVAHAPFAHGAPVLDVHIPESGSLDPAACDASLRWASTFFTDRFDEEPALACTCTSWLLDDQLATRLTATSNIVRFQRRFRVLPGGLPGDDDVRLFVFRRPSEAGPPLPRRTSLERAVADHLADGGHWQVRSGWAPLPA